MKKFSFYYGCVVDVKYFKGRIFHFDTVENTIT